MPKCKNCHGEKIEIFPKGSVAKARRCPSCFVICPECKGDGMIFTRDEQGRDYMKPCACLVLDTKIELFNQAEVPAQFYDATLQNFITDHPSLKEALSMAKLCHKNIKGGKWKGLLFMGGVGVGKTRLVASMIRSFTLEHGIPCLFQEFSSLLSDIKSGYDKGISEHDLLSRINDTEILVIDELGKGRKSEWEVQILDQIISHRYNMRKTTLFTTNYTDDPKTTYQDLSKKGEENGETLAARVMPRIYSRLHEMCDFVRMEGPDRRLMEAGKH